jgi:hypothetical protein
MLQAGEVYFDVKEVLGRCDPAYVYRIMSDAIELLANKQPNTGPAWQPLLIYINLPVTQSYYVTLPSQVETALRVNINKTPAFPRAQLYEFTMNGPGTEDAELGWSWQERGDTPIQQPIPFPCQLGLSCDATNDAGVELQLLVTLSDQTEQLVTMGAATTLLVSGPANVIDVMMVSKPVTIGPVRLYTAQGAPLAVYQPQDTVPTFQRIKLSQKAASVRILAKRRTAAVALATDIIPLNSKMAIIMMSKAIKLYKEDHYQEGATCEVQAVHFLEEDQASRISYTDVSTRIDTARTLSASITNRDTVIVADIYDDVADIVGPIGRQNLFDVITHAIETLANKSHWDALLGVVDICVQNPLTTPSTTYVTLPRFVEQILEINICNYPADFLSKWFQFHLNGLGSSNVNRPCRTWEEVGEVTTAFWWKDPVPMVVIPDIATDNDAGFVVYGRDANDNPLRDWKTNKPGMSLPCVFGSYAYDPNNIVPIQTIDRIVKDPTVGGLSLWATDGTQGTQFIGYYWPEDTEPYFRRIKIPQQQASVRIMYRKRWLKITSLLDPIPLRSRMAIISACRGIQQSKTDPMKGAAFMAEALGYIQEEFRINSNPRMDVRIQMNPRVYGGNFGAPMM